jgi:flagellar motor component MotA
MKTLAIPIIGSIIAVLVFAIDTLVGLGCITIFYNLFLYFIVIHSNSKNVMMATTVIILLLSLIGLIFSFNWIFDYDNIVRLCSMASLLFTSIFAITQKEKEFEFKQLKDSLELRILARISASEARTKALEQQIIILQSIRVQNTIQSLSKLDDVINDLKALNNLNND